MSESEVAWLAGIFDGEGSIVLTHRKRRSSTSICILVGNTHKPMIEKIVEVTGVGAVSFQARSQQSSRRLDFWTWRLGGDAARELLRRMRPWLLAKAERADAALTGEYFARQARWNHIYPPE